MDTFAQMISAVQSDLTINSNSTLFPPATVMLAINRAYRKAASLFKWPETEDSETTGTIASQEYYDYPSNWVPDSIWKVTVNGEDLGDPLVFKDYLYEQENTFPNGIKTIWSSQWRRFFILIDGVAPTTTGSNNISIWGHEAVSSLANNDDVTIFSYSQPEINEAIVLEAVAILDSKGGAMSSGQFKSAEAKQILATAWQKIRQNQTKYEKTTPFFDVPNFFPKSRNKDVKSNTGNF